MFQISSISLSPRLIFPAMGTFLALAVILSGLALTGLYSGLSPLPEKYLGSQYLHQSVANAELALQNARVAENKEELIRNLDFFEKNIAHIYKAAPNLFSPELANKSHELREVLDQHTGLGIRLTTYLYVIDNAHREFLSIHQDQTDKAYFNLVSETDRSESVPDIVNEYVTPLVSTTQLGTDVNLIVANLEKAETADQKPAVRVLEKSSQEALKRINAALNLHKDSPAQADIEDITFQIVSFAHGPNNIFEIKQALLSLKEDIATLSRFYERELLRVKSYSQEQRATYAGQLYQEIESAQSYLSFLLFLNVGLFIAALIYALIQFKGGGLADKRQIALEQDDQKTKPVSKAQERQVKDVPLRTLGQTIATIRDFHINKMKKHIGRGTQEAHAGQISVGKKSVDDTDNVENEAIQPLLLDTNMRIEAQRQKLKQALSQLNEGQSLSEKSVTVGETEATRRITKKDISTDGNIASSQEPSLDKSGSEEAKGPATRYIDQHSFPSLEELIKTIQDTADRMDRTQRTPSYMPAANIDESSEYQASSQSGLNWSELYSRSYQEISKELSKANRGRVARNGHSQDRLLGHDREDQDAGQRKSGEKQSWSENWISERKDEILGASQFRERQSSRPDKGAAQDDLAKPYPSSNAKESSETRDEQPFYSSDAQGGELVARRIGKA